MRTGTSQYSRRVCTPQQGLAVVQHSPFPIIKYVNEFSFLTSVQFFHQYLTHSFDTQMSRLYPTCVVSLLYFSLHLLHLPNLHLQANSTTYSPYGKLRSAAAQGDVLKGQSNETFAFHSLLSLGIHVLVGCCFSKLMAHMLSPLFSNISRTWPIDFQAFVRIWTFHSCPEISCYLC